MVKTLLWEMVYEITKLNPGLGNNVIIIMCNDKQVEYKLTIISRSNESGITMFSTKALIWMEQEHTPSLVVEMCI